MSGKTLEQLTAAELRCECTARGLSISGSKSDVIIRLEDNIRENGQDPTSIRFCPVQPSITILTDGTGEQPYATSSRIDAEATWVNRQLSESNTASPSVRQSLPGGRPVHSGLQPSVQQGEPVQK